MARKIKRRTGRKSRRSIKRSIKRDLEKSLRKTIERSIKKSLNKFNKRIKKYKRKKQKKKKIQRGGEYSDQLLLIQIFDKRYTSIGSIRNVAPGSTKLKNPEIFKEKNRILTAMEQVITDYKARISKAGGEG